MTVTRLSSKGQVIIPKPIRSTHHWEQGQQLAVVDTGDGILLKPASPFHESCLEDVAGFLRYSGKPKTLKDMEDAIKQGVQERAA